MTSGTARSVSPNAKLEPHPPSRWTDAARALVQHTGLASPCGAAAALQRGREAKGRSSSALVQMVRFRPRERDPEEQRTAPASLQGSEGRTGVLFRAVLAQPGGVQVQAAFLLEPPRDARQRSTALQGASQSLMRSQEAKEEEEICGLGSSDGVAPVALYRLQRRTFPGTGSLRCTCMVVNFFRGKTGFANLI